MPDHLPKKTNIIEAYEELRSGDFVIMHTATGDEGVKVDGALWLTGQHKPLQIVSSRGRRYALGFDDRISFKERGF